MRMAFQRRAVSTLLQRREQDADRSGHQDQAEPDDDASVRRGEQVLVAAERDVPRDVAVEALAGDEQAEQRQPDRGGGPPRDVHDAFEGVGDAQQDPRRARLRVARAAEDEQADQR